MTRISSFHARVTYVNNAFEFRKVGEVINIGLQEGLVSSVQDVGDENDGNGKAGRHRDANH